MNAPVSNQDFVADSVPAALLAVTATAIPTLADLIGSVGSFAWLDRAKQTHMQGRLLRLARLLGDTPAGIPLDMGEIGMRLEKVDRIACRVSAKTITNIRWALVTAVGKSGLVPEAVGVGRHGTKLSDQWEALFAGEDLAVRAGLSRLAHYASRHGIEPSAIDDHVVGDLMAELEVASLRQNQARLHRSTALRWNKLAASEARPLLRTLTVPPSRLRRTRIRWDELPQSFRDDLERYLIWCSGTNLFAEEARAKPLNAESIATHKRNIHAAVTSLIGSGAAEPRSLLTLADLVRPEHVERVLQYRHDAVGGQKNYVNASVATVLVQIARDWVKVDEGVLKRLKAMVRKVPRPRGEMTARNRETLRRFDDPAVLRTLDELPKRLWAEVLAAPNPGKWTLAKAQAAIGIAIETYMAFRLRNLSELCFDRHVHLRSAHDATSTLELSAEEVKGHHALAFDIPSDLATMLLHYRDEFVPKITGRRPIHVFVNVDGVTRKGKASVRYLMQSNLKKAGVLLNPHAFRHLAGKRILDMNPGHHEMVKQLLGHESVETTVRFYTGVNTRRAGNYFQQLLESSAAGGKDTKVAGGSR